jgi:hypothetical protein
MRKKLEMPQVLDGLPQQPADMLTVKTIERQCQFRFLVLQATLSKLG